MPVQDTVQPPNTSRSTRQLIDELDALMERMLTLPVEPETPPATVQLPETHSDNDAVPLDEDELPAKAPSPAVMAVSLTLLDSATDPAVDNPSLADDAVADSSVGENQSNRHQPIDEEPSTLHETATLPTIELDIPVEPTLPPPEEVVEFVESEEGVASWIEAPPPPSDSIPTPFDSEAPSRRQPWFVRLPFRWLVRFNRGFDDTAVMIGPFGHILSSPPGRQIVGIVGIGMILFSSLWFLLTK